MSTEPQPEPLSDRLEPNPGDAPPISSIEVQFGLPVYLTVDQDRQLQRLFYDIVHARCNQVLEGVHWVSSAGSKPNWSKLDAAFLGHEAEPSAPDSGEPSFADSVYYIETSCRPFGSEKEARREERERDRPSVDPSQRARLHRRLDEFLDQVARAKPRLEDESASFKVEGGVVGSHEGRDLFDFGLEVLFGECNV